MKEYWLNIHPDTFIWMNNETISIYNAENGIFFKVPYSKELEKIVNDLQEVDNLYTTTITEKDLKAPAVDNWIKKLIETDCCNWVVNDGINPKAISLKPVLKLTDNLDYYKDGHHKKRNANLLSNLHRLVIYLNSSKYGSDIYARQCIYPFKQQKELNLKELCDFIVSSGSPIYLSEIIFVGCLWKHQEYDMLLNFLNQLSVKVSVYCTEQDFHNYIVQGQTPDLPKESTLYILKNQYTKDDSQFNALATQENLIWHFLLTSEEDYMEANDLLQKHKIEKYRLIPVYTGNNRSFLENFIYMSEDEILDCKLSKREVFTNQTLNANYFGTLQILPDGLINAGNKVIGNIMESLYDVVYREMTEGDSWFHIRNQKPCCNCCYQWLCPSPSNYESVLKKPNLCSVAK